MSQGFSVVLAVLDLPRASISPSAEIGFIYIFCVVRERETPPRFAQHGTFEYEYSQRWKSLDEMEKQQREQVEKNMKDAKDKLESEMEDAYHEHQANLLRQGEKKKKPQNFTKDQLTFFYVSRVS